MRQGRTSAGYPAALVLSGVLAASACLASAAHAVGLAVGDAAPDFELSGSDGAVYRLHDLLEKGGEKGIILAWFPKAFTPG